MRALIAILAVLLLVPFPASARAAASVGAVMGSVISENHILLEGAEVVLEGFGRVSTDSQGRFSFSRVPPGNYRLNVYKQGFPSYNRAMSVRAGVTEQVDVTLAGLAETPTTQGGQVAVPLIRAGNAFIVRAVLNGRREVSFYLDTGASITTISTGLARELGISFGPGSPTTTIVTASDRIVVPLASVESIQVGGAEARDVQVAVFDLPQGTRVTGLLGNSFLSHFRVQLDPVNGVLVLGQ